MIFKPPLKVHLGWFNGKGVDPQCAAIARELYEFFHRPLADDVVLRPGLEIPVEFGRSVDGLLDALEAKTEPEVGVRLVVAILDGAAYRQPSARNTIKRALARWPDVRPDEVFVPIVLDKRWYGVLPAGAQQMLAAVAVGHDVRGKDRRWKLGAEVAVVAARALLRRQGVKNPPKPRVLVSHSKADGLKLTKGLVAHFDTKTKLGAWFDEADVSHGEELGRQLDEASGDGVVLVVRTDSYSESPWCARELLMAKQAATPIVTLLATSDGEPWTSAYGGNHRTMNWRAGREWEVVARCAQGWLHGHHFQAHARAALTRAGLPAESEVIPRRPELLDLRRADGGRHRSILVHPDPPVTAEELQLLRQSRPSVRLATPSTLFGRVLLATDPMPPLHGIKIGFSLSVAEDLPKIEQARVGNGLTQQHLDDVVYAIVLATLNSGASIAYGGDFRKVDGYTKKLSDLHRSRRRLGTGAKSQLLCFLDADAGDRDGDGGEIEFESISVEAPAGAKTFRKLRSVLWHMSMRQTMAAICDARVMVGGKVRPGQKKGDGGYGGPWPGFLEEAWRTLEHGGALYLVGGFGGAAGLITEMLLGDAVPEALKLRAPANSPLRPLTRALDVARAKLRRKRVDSRVLMAKGKGFAGIEEMASSILTRWVGFTRHGRRGDWDNCLSEEENRRLFRSTDRTEIMHLVFEGLRRRAARRPATTAVALYHGDIASVPDVEAYAVTVTPGVPLAGGAKALDQRMNGRIAGCTWSENQQVAIIPVNTAELVGSYVVVVRLPLPAPGSAIGADQLEQLACLAAMETDQRGIASIAVVPFGTTLGVSVAESALAIERGYRSGGGLHKTLVFCEADRARYQQLREALATASELRAGPSPVSSRPSVILNVELKVPTSANPMGQVRSTLLVPDSGAPVIPLHDVPLTWPVWFSIRNRYVDFAATKRMGRLLWQTVLSPDMRTQIAERMDRPLVVVGDENASGLPWEILTDDQDRAPALSGGLIRRIALTGAMTEMRPRNGVGTSLRVLLVYNPDGLRSVLPEKEEIETALRGRADVHVHPLESPTRSEVATELKDGYYDVLHYAGHAAFDEKIPGRSGLALADGVFNSEDLKDLNSPRLVFLSACESGRVRQQQQQELNVADGWPLAEAFLRRGVEALLGTFFAVDDRAAREFASTVYAELAAGQTLGTAVRTARVQRHLAQDPEWANFLLYGDETLVL